MRRQVKFLMAGVIAAGLAIASPGMGVRPAQAEALTTTAAHAYKIGRAHV